MDRTYAKEQAKKLVARMTVEEKASQLLFHSPAIERLGIREYNWWNEASHGVARAGTATVFPHSIALASTFDPPLIRRIADAVSDEARAKYNQSIHWEDRGIYKGLTFWCPNINIYRDPRWGRGQETLGEDPYLTAILGAEYIRGLQGDGPYLKTAACSKHYAAHSGPEGKRHGFNAVVSNHDLWETYLPAFEWTITKANVAGVMGAYSALNGVPCCCSKELLQTILREQWGFEGYVVSDCGALRDIHRGHHFTDSDEESAALALKSGCNLNCGWAFEKLMDAYEMDLIEEKDLTEAAEQLFTIRYLLGEFEENPPYADIPFSIVDCQAHRELNLAAARDTMVLLKNQDGFLPVDPQKLSRIAVIGPNAMNITALEGNYNGDASRYVTVVDGMREVFPHAEILFSKGSHLWKEWNEDNWDIGDPLSDGVTAAAHADLTVLCLGLDRSIECEEGKLETGYAVAGDKLVLSLPKTQQKLAEAVCDVCDNVVVILMSGGALDLGEKVNHHAKAIIQAWYPGSLGGLAAAELIAGVYSPSGKLPLTFYRTDAPLPDIADYAMTNRTYRYYEDTPLYPFGFGLSYTSFCFDDLCAVRTEDGWLVEVTVANTGSMAGTAKMQAYAEYQDSRTVTPIRQLCGLCPVELAPGEARRIQICIPDFWVKAVLDDGSRVCPDGSITLYVGDHQPDAYSTQLSGTQCLQCSLPKE